MFKLVKININEEDLRTLTLIHLISNITGHIGDWFVSCVQYDVFEVLKLLLL